MKTKKFILVLLLDIIGAAAFAAAMYFFIKPSGFLTGGIGGIALILNYYFNLPVGVMTIVMNIPVVIFTWKTLGRNFIFHTVRILIIYTIFVDILFPMLPYYEGDAILAALFGGLIGGAALGFLNRGGTCTGGIDFVIYAINKKAPHRSVGSLNILVSGVVIVAGGFVYGSINAVLYGIVQSVVVGYTFDKMIIGAHSGKTAMIITSLPHEVSTSIFREMDRGATIFKGEGAYTGTERDMVLCACSKAQVVRLRAAVRRADNQAIVMISDYKETFGKGFDQL